jgi:hypothetical protein
MLYKQITAKRHLTRTVSDSHDDFKVKVQFAAQNQHIINYFDLNIIHQGKLYSNYHQYKPCYFINFLFMSIEARQYIWV